MKWSMITLVLLGLCFVLPGSGNGSEQEITQAIKIIIKQGAGSAEGRVAWNKVVAAGPAALPQILAGMNCGQIVAVNWLRTAFDRIVIQAGKTNQLKKIRVASLLEFATNVKNQGRGRRLALELVERLKPGTSEKLYSSWLSDPEFRFEAVTVTVKAGDKAFQTGNKAQALQHYRKAFAAVRDLPQAKTVAVKLLSCGAKVSVADHLGFFRDWYVIGPFDANGLKGFKAVYPPEKQLDLKAVYQGKGKKVLWKRYRVVEPSPSASGPHVALVNLRAPLGDADDAVAYAFTEFTVKNAQTAEFRGAGDDNFTVWVNGKRVFGFEEYRNGVRLDRHRFDVELKKGKNAVLVKVCQYLANSEPNWEFLLRAVDQTGKGVEFQSTLP